MTDGQTHKGESIGPVSLQPGPKKGQNGPKWLFIGQIGTKQYFFAKNDNIDSKNENKENLTSVSL